MPAKKMKIMTARSAGDIDFEVGNRIRAFRLDRALSQEELGTELGISFQQIQKYEKGANRLSVGRLLEVAKVLGVTPHDLIGYEKSNSKLDGPIDVECFKLAKEFLKLSPPLRPAVRALITVINNNQE